MPLTGWNHWAQPQQLLLIWLCKLCIVCVYDCYLLSLLSLFCRYFNACRSETTWKILLLYGPDRPSKSQVTLCVCVWGHKLHPARCKGVCKGVTSGWFWKPVILWRSLPGCCVGVSTPRSQSSIISSFKLHKKCKLKLQNAEITIAILHKFILKMQTETNCYTSICNPN